MDYIFYMGSMCAVENVSYIGHLNDYAMEASTEYGIKNKIMSFIHTIAMLFKRVGRIIKQAIHNVITKLKSKNPKSKDKRIKELEEKEETYREQIAQLKKKLEEKSEDATKLRAEIKSLDIEVERLVEERKNYHRGLSTSIKNNSESGFNTTLKGIESDVISASVDLMNRYARALTQFKSTNEVGVILNFIKHSNSNMDRSIENFKDASETYIHALNKLYESNDLSSSDVSSSNRIVKYLDDVSTSLEKYSNILETTASNLTKAPSNVSDTAEFKDAQNQIALYQKGIADVMKIYVQMTSKICTIIKQYNN